MTETTHTFDWRFGGPLAGLSPALAWTLLAAAFLLGLVLIVVSYRRTLVHLAPAPRRTLTTLRVLLWLGVLLALAGPSRVERTTTRPENRPLAVLVDQSASMTTPDNRRQRRADDALRRWRALSPAAREAHGDPQLFAFADTPSPIPLKNSPSDATTLAASTLEGLPNGQTRLFASLDRLLAQAPPGGWGGIVTLTDGLDTVAPSAPEALSATSRAALAAGTPLYFLSGRNRASSGPLLAFRDIAIPATVPPRSTFRLEVTLDTYQPSARRLPLRLRVGQTWRDLEPLALEPGRRALVWGTDIPADAPGIVPVELHAGSGAEAIVARAEVNVAAPSGTRILYYQGALDWGYRFLADILRRDPAFTVKPVFNLAPDRGGSVGRGAAAPSALPGTQLPDSATALSAYDLIILANARASQFTPAQQAALSTWVRTGGILLFLAPDDHAARGWSGSELEKMLPVVFLAPTRDSQADDTLASFREQMSRYGGSQRDIEQDFAHQASRTTRVAPLHTFAWEPRARQLLGDELASATPQFAHYARVRRAKPGAEVLARHPRERSADSNEGAILLAQQRYGKGRSVVLTSDALWRWKLRQPSKDRDVERFWQNLISWLGRESIRGLRFDRPLVESPVGREVAFRLLGGSTKASLSATPEPRPDEAPGAPAPKPLALLPTSAADASEFRFTPPAPGLWRLTARDTEGFTVRHWLHVSATPTGEASGLPPDEALLRDLADRTGGALLADAPPPAWRAARSESTLLRERHEPLWHAPWIFAALLALYCTELLLRRHWRLL